MGLFDDPGKLLNRNFGWGLASYTESISEDGEPADVQKLALFVDGEGVLNAEGKIMLWNEKDPVDSAFLPTFSKKNLFVEGLKKVINPFPTYGVLLFPTILPDSRELISEGGFFGPIVSGGASVKFPRDTPEGFVPCAGQVLRYPGKVTIVVPNLAPRVVDIGDGGTSVQTYAPPGTAYMMKVPDGWTEMVPDLRGKDLGDFGTAAVGGFFG